MKELPLNLDSLELEKLCPDCEGRRGERERGEWYVCNKCSGAGLVPTGLGKKVFDLFRHNFAALLRSANGE